MPAPAGLVAELSRLLAPERVLSRDIDLVVRSRDASLYRLVPQAVVQPRDLAEVRSLFAWARRERRHLTFRTAGTSLSGQAVTDDILVDLTRHWRSFRLLDGGRRVWSQPAVVGGHLNRLLQPLGVRLGPDPASIDAAMLGGILANNSSGMCCGVAQNSYHTLDALTLLLADGTCLDTARPDADAQLRAAAPVVHAGLLRLRDETRGDAPLADRIRRKFARKNTTGYSLNAFLDYDRPADILAHLMVGSEGTLGFIADATLRTVPDPPCRATALVVFDALVEAGAAVAPLAAAGAAALEILDSASLRSIQGELGLGRPIERKTAALLVEMREGEGAALDAAVARALGVLRGFDVAAAPAFTRAPAERERLWRLRKGLFISTGALRPPGTAIITEDVAVPVERLAEAIADFQELFARKGVPETAVFGHAKDGNLHFNLAEDVRRPEAVRRYAAFMQALVDLVSGKYDGALKAEHGSGRNMAPFVRAEWGDAAWEAMWRVKRLLDPDGILNPGIVLNRDPEIHLKSLKAMPEISPLADKCIECGFCEARCPSRDLTLTPRQRIAVVRELSGAGRALREALEREFAYDGIDTCAGDGMCETSCPVKIDAGALVKELKAARHPPAAHWLAGRVADEFGLAACLARLGLRAGRLVRLGLPMPAGRLPAVRPRPGWPRVVYFPSCLTRIVGEEPGVVSRAKAMLDVLVKAGFDAVYPDGIDGLCCGLAFSSKGYPQAAERARERSRKALSEIGHGAPVVTDASPCAGTLGILDFPVFWAREGLSRVTPRRLPGKVVLHPACSLVKAGGLPDLLRVARAHCEETALPTSAECCGFAGDRGFLVPELTASATRAEALEVGAVEAAHHCSTTRTCEIGLSRATGRLYVSLVHLVRESLLG
ncbi:MAG TPA: FAD-binding and (Fe-S)-binding domain-containing protein [Vicinamibacteria bacterium]|nr:FAD-binding and (Fe-S)-binding domain-containing protein [Vicinamibacteria bacterium]